VTATPRFDVSTGGELLGVLSARRTGPLEQVDEFIKGIGGAEVNVAIGLAGLGHTVTWWGAVGDDPFGRHGLELLRAAGVNISAASVDTDHPTGIYVKEFPNSDTARAHYYRTGSAATHLRPCQLDLDLVLDCRMLHLTGITAALRADVVHHVAGAARDRGVVVTLDVNIRPALLAGRTAADVIGPVAALADIILATPDEIRAVFGDADPATLATICQRYDHTAIVVHDATTATAIDAEGVTARSTVTRREVVDPVGAGDAFASGFLAGILRGLDHLGALNLAHERAARVLSVLGDNESALLSAGVQ
jgi:2-dehydro-3-deoxygluconokinase